MKRAQLDYKESETHGFFEIDQGRVPEGSRSRTANSKGWMTTGRCSSSGMPRSGSTLVEQILSSHPDVYGAGEVKYLAGPLGSYGTAFHRCRNIPI